MLKPIILSLASICMLTAGAQVKEKYWLDPAANRVNRGSTTFRLFCF